MTSPNTTSIESLVRDALGPRLPTPPPWVRELEPEERADLDGFVMEIMRAAGGFWAAVYLGWQVGPAVHTALVDHADQPNTTLAPYAKRGTVSKWINRGLRNLGREVRYPKKARKGSAKGSTRRKAVMTFAEAKKRLARMKDRKAAA